MNNNNIEINKINEANELAEILKNKMQKQVNCSFCQVTFGIKFVNSRRDYSQKNLWGYWTEREEDKDKYICSLCLKRKYYGDRIKFMQEVKSFRKRNVMANYLHNKLL